MKKTFLLTIITTALLLFFTISCKKDVIEKGGVNKNENLTIITVDGPKKNSCGGFEWSVKFQLKEKSKKGGWIVQKLTIAPSIHACDGTLIDGPAKTYWEAWHIMPDSKDDSARAAGLVKYDDVFAEDEHPDTYGEISFSGEVKFFEDLALPADFIRDNPETNAGELPSTTKKPAFWDSKDAVPHVFSTAWNCCVLPKTVSYTIIPEDGGSSTVPKKTDPSKLDGTGKNILKIPSWIDGYYTAEGQALVNVSREIMHTNSLTTLRNSLVNFQAVVAGSSDYFEQGSKAYLLLRTIFQVPQSMNMSNAKVFGGWMQRGTNTSNGNFNMSWPVFIVQGPSGYQVNVAQYSGYAGRTYDPVAEFDYFRQHFPVRNL